MSVEPSTRRAHVGSGGTMPYEYDYLEAYEAAEYDELAEYDEGAEYDELAELADYDEAEYDELAGYDEAEYDEAADYDEGAEYDETAEYEPEYGVTRVLLAPQYHALPTQHIESILSSAFPDMTPADAEDFFRSVGNAFRQVGQTVAQRAPGILSGAVTGATTGAALGPWGALGGALVGGTVGGLTSAPPPPAGRPSSAPPRPPGVGAPPPAVAGAPIPPPAAPAGAPRQLLQLLAQPQVYQALLAATLGNAGRPTLPAGQGSVPVSSILAALGNFATRAAEELSAESGYDEEVPAYLSSAEGDYAVDLANADARATHLMNVLAQANEGIFEYDEDYD